MNRCQKFTLIFALLFSIVTIENSKASIISTDISDGFMFKPALTLEYQSVDIKGNGQNGKFKEEVFGKQLRSFDNIAFGFNFRIHKYIGLNANMVKFGMNNESLNEHNNLITKAGLDTSLFNFSSLFYVPIIGDNFLEAYGELGLSDVRSKLKFQNSSGAFVIQKNHETAPLYGAGIQFNPYDLDMTFRFGVQTYNTRLGTLGNNIVTWRGGIIKYF